jgi:two-component system, LytTR family, sensor kinase
MNPSGATKQQLVVWGLVLALWGLLVLAFAGQLVFTASVPWSDAIAISFRDWVPWLVLGPIVAWLAGRFPFEREKLAMSVPVHVVACMLALLGAELIMRPIRPGPRLPPGPQHLAAPQHFSGERERPPVPPPLGGPGSTMGPGPRPLFVEAFARRVQFNLPVYWIIVSIVHVLRFYRRLQDRDRSAAELEARLAEAKLDALRMQLHPHFLFNTLNAISTLVHKDPNAADDMIGNLSELLRATLDLSSTNEIPLRDELEITDRYLQIQQVRLGERLRIRREIDSAALDAAVPTMILQPLVENAVRHGIESSPGPGLLRIEARRSDGILRIVISNSSDGMSSPRKGEEGIGLANTRARLRELYGSQARMVLADGPGPAWSVELQLPFREAAAAAADKQRGTA